ncbi:MAG: calcium-binding protein [Hyphomicrobiales bacterium]
MSADGFIITTSSDTALNLEGAGVWTVKIDGGLWSKKASDTNSNAVNDGTGLVLYNYAATANDKVTVGAEGSIAGSETGIFSSVAADITNSGQIVGYLFGMDFNGQAGPGNNGSESNLNVAGKKLSITNNAGAQIAGQFIGVNNNSFAALTVKNAGTIDGGTTTNWSMTYDGAAINASKSALTLTNTGTINGNVEGGWVGNKIDNSGTINGTLSFYLNNNFLSGSLFDIDHDGDYGDAATKGAVTITGTTTVANTITNKGTINGVEDYGFDGFTTFQVAMNLSDGREVVTNSGKIFGDVWLNGGDDSFTNTGTVKGYVDGWTGNNTITNSGTIEYGVGGQGGVDVLDNKGKINGNVNLNGGDDVLKNSGTITQWVDMGDGHNVTTNTKGTLASGIGGNNDVDEVTNTGTIGNADHLQNADTVVDLHGGNDILTNTAGTILGVIRMGAGNDTLNGGKGAEYVAEEDGQDKYLLGDGNDYLDYSSADAFADTIDGGAGTADTIFFGDLASAITLDLAAKTLTVGANPTDTVFNFEIVKGTSSGDTIKGSSAAETIEGNNGADIITGRGGKDILSGGSGADTFVYEFATDSGKTRATRDVITDFTQGVVQDKIQLDFDANTTNGTGVDDFSATIVANGVFTHTAGELRYTWQGSQTIIEGDTNGDGKADFSIALEGHFALTSTDFIL